MWVYVLFSIGIISYICIGKKAHRMWVFVNEYFCAYNEMNPPTFVCVCSHHNFNQLHHMLVFSNISPCSHSTTVVSLCSHHHVSTQSHYHVSTQSHHDVCRRSHYCRRLLVFTHIAMSVLTNILLSVLTHIHMLVCGYISVCLHLLSVITNISVHSHHHVSSQSHKQSLT